MIKKPRPQLTRTVVVRHDCSWAVTGKVCELSNPFQVFTPNEMVIVPSDRRPEACYAWCLLSHLQELSYVAYFASSIPEVEKRRVASHASDHVLGACLPLLDDNPWKPHSISAGWGRYWVKVYTTVPSQQGLARRSHFRCATWHQMLPSSRDPCRYRVSILHLTRSRRAFLVFTQHTSVLPCTHTPWSELSRVRSRRWNTNATCRLRLTFDNAGMKCAIDA